MSDHSFLLLIESYPVGLSIAILGSSYPNGLHAVTLVK